MATEHDIRTPLNGNEHGQPKEAFLDSPPDYSDNAEMFAHTLDDQTVRRHFIRKVFVVLGMQLLFTFGLVCVFTFSADVRLYVGKTPALYYSSFGIFIFFLIVLNCCGDVRRRHPWNFICLALLTLSLSYMVGTVASFYETSSVMIALGSTVAVCFAIILFASQTRLDFTYCYGFLLVLSTVLIMFGFFCIFFYNHILQIVYGSLGALLFSVFLAADTQLILGRHRFSLTPEEYVFGALILYLDIINIFLYLLMILGGSRQ
ncbi:protein lifeguard 1-like [Heptranchias perlo]|uniref:protein lifeguard 1-like n=1 Tax=Heptranchias perlo TaxID=212740 RepID=UPI00355A40A0